jgi:serine phosphatase RsbU (regulator of sigma subunit)
LVILMLVKSVLDRITADVCHDDPARILRELNAMIRTTLNRGRSSSDDGLDVGLCYVRGGSGEVVYAGAKLGLYYCRDGAVHEVRGQGQGIGYRESDESFGYVNHTLPSSGDTVFTRLTATCTRRRRRRISWAGSGRRTSGRELPKPMAEQRKAIEEALHSWRGEQPQRDDITMFGFGVDPIESPDSTGRWPQKGEARSESG